MNRSLKCPKCGKTGRLKRSSLTGNYWCRNCNTMITLDRVLELRSLLLKRSKSEKDVKKGCEECGDLIGSYSKDFNKYLCSICRKKIRNGTFIKKA